MRVFAEAGGMGDAGGGAAAGLLAFFAADHKACDVRWADVEAAVDAGNDEAAKQTWAAFEQAMERHLRMEEEVLFPAFEAATGMSGGPTAVMRIEHEQMRGLLRQMSALMAAGEGHEVLDQGDTLLMLIQQHNAKEENMLYPMAQQVLGAQWSELHRKLTKV